MKRLPRNEYNEAVNILKRYKYNCLSISNIQKDLIGVSSSSNDGQPKAPYKISDPVFNTIINIQENKYLNKALKEYKIVEKAKALLNDKEIDYIFEKFFIEKKSKWEIIDELNLTEETYKRRKRALIYAVHNEKLKSQ